jgi:Na+-transporting NADH:ubiquinone oxidoreductase subunit NqrC
MMGLKEKNGGLISMIIIVVLVILLLCAVVYIGIGKYKEKRAEKEQALLQQGYQLAVVQLMQQAKTCQPVTIYSGNETMQIVDMDCFGIPTTGTNSSKSSLQNLQMFGLV